MAKIWKSGESCLIVEGLASISHEVVIRQGTIIKDRGASDDYVSVKVIEDGVSKNLGMIHRAYLVPDNEKTKEEMNRLREKRNQIKKMEAAYIGEVYRFFNAISRGEME